MVGVWAEDWPGLCIREHCSKCLSPVFFFFYRTGIKSGSGDEQAGIDLRSDQLGEGEAGDRSGDKEFSDRAEKPRHLAT